MNKGDDEEGGCVMTEERGEEGRGEADKTKDTK